jgi:hypothetical protein
MLLEMNPAVQPAKQLDAATKRPIQWALTVDALTPYQAQVDQSHWRLQVNDFPAEALYTLLIDGQPVGDLDEWPEPWQRP